MSELGKLKSKIEETLNNLGVEKYSDKIAENAECSYETVRRWFRKPALINTKVEKAALELVESEKENYKIKMQSL